MNHILLCVLIPLVLSYEYRGYDKCHKQVDCSACISHHPTCSWCADQGEDKDMRCRTYSETDTCTDLTNPEGGGTAATLQDVEFGEELVDGSIAQIKPQIFEARVRNGSTVKFSVKVQPAKDFPLDLYFVMDHSFSMNGTLTTLKNSVAKMSEKLKELTSNHRIGFGTFVDKTTSPFIYTTKNRRNNPCDNGSGVKCPPAYNFNNTVSLNEFNEFSTLIANSEVSASVDLPEAGMDALMQVAACKDAIGWRDHSRKIIAYLTDTGFHFAGDGKLGGQIERNDGECWLLDQRTYSKEQILDYPSVHQVIKKMVDNQMIPIFGVTEKVINLYSQLRAYFPYGSVGVLEDDSSNLVNLIVDEYKNISSKIIPRLTESISGIEMNYMAKCPRNDYEGQNNAECANVGIDEYAEFDFEITATECLGEPRDMIIEFTGFGQITVNLGTLCDCDCSKTELVKYSGCTGNGNFQCGGCVCSPGWSGDVCACAEGDLGEVAGCRPEEGARPCSGSNKGKCRCGKCDCTPPNYGPFCQCDNTARYCDCSGHGECVCSVNATQSECLCNEGWTGNRCECTTDESDCMFNGKECDGNGECQCGKCVCNEEYSGKYCQLCEYCDKCPKFSDCVLCVLGSNGTTGQKPEKCESCGVAFEVHLTDEEFDSSWCTLEEGDCTYYFKHQPVPEIPTREILYIQQEPDCGPINIIWVIVGVMLAIILLGILIICCWKCAVMYKDKQEYKKFLEDMENTKFASTQSPLYNNPITHVINPIAKKM